MDSRRKYTTGLQGIEEHAKKNALNYRSKVTHTNFQIAEQHRRLEKYHRRQKEKYLQLYYAEVGKEFAVTTDAPEIKPEVSWYRNKPFEVIVGRKRYKEKSAKKVVEILQENGVIRSAKAFYNMKRGQVKQLPGRKNIQVVCHK